MAGILYREFNTQFIIPAGVDLQFAFAYPLGIIFDNGFHFEIVFDVEFVQSDPDREKFVPSLGVEPDLAPQGIHRLGFDTHVLFPLLVVGQKQAVIFGGPSLGAIGPIRTHRMQNFP